jgi:urocanate hydratase
MLLPELSTVHDQFLALSQFGHPLRGKLLLRSQLDAGGIAAVIAASIAGAASLCVDADADRLREGLRAGFIDFVVGDLDESLRILKNELRRARPVSVGVTVNPARSIAAMIERGLQPDLLSAISPPHASMFKERGAVVVPAHAVVEAETSLLEWSVAENPARTVSRLAELAAAAIDPMRTDTPPRRRWLEQSTRYLGRSFAMRQCLRMTAAEIARLLPSAHVEFPAAKITRDGQPA